MGSQPIGRSEGPPKTTGECHMAILRIPESTKKQPTFGGAVTVGTFWLLASGVN